MLRAAFSHSDLQFDFFLNTRRLRRAVVGKTYFPTALHQLNGMRRKKECFPVLRLAAPAVPVSPAPCEKQHWRFYPKKQEVRPLVHLGQLLDGGGKNSEGYRSLGMFNIKNAIRTWPELWELDRKYGE